MKLQPKANAPVCAKLDCRANARGYCNCLDDNKFNEECPFYKSNKQWNEEEMNRLSKQKRV